jgi:predicted MFS family arabinose efflux permease
VLLVRWVYELGAGEHGHGLEAEVLEDYVHFLVFLALGWGIRQLTAWPFAIALSLVAQFGPSLLLSPYAGSVADRYDRRTVVIAGNVLMVFPPVALGVLVSLGVQTIPSILALAAVGGVAQAMTQPAMVAIVPRIVPEDEIAQAIAGQSVLGNLTRVVGPSFGAIAINAWGLSSAFYLNAASFLAVVVAWTFVRPPVDVRGADHESFWSRIREGLAYSRRHPQVLLLLGYAAVMSLVVYHAALLPVIATDVLHSGASGYGLLQSATGIGAICGALFAGEITSDRRRRVALVSGVLATAAAYVVVALSRSLAVSMVGLGVYGLAFFMAGTVSQSVLLTAADDAYRGRVMGLYSTMVVGGVPIAALTGGALGSVLGVAEAVGVAAVVMSAYGAWFVLSRAYRAVAVDDLLAEQLAPEGAT